MKRTVLVIGIGVGNPDHLTLQAIDALRRADVIFIPNKGRGKDDLARVRRDLCERFARASCRVVEFEVPRREAAGDYCAYVDAWHEQLSDLHARLLRTELGENECGAFLVWGDPSLYDSTLRILERINAAGLAFDCEVVPGISSVQALAAAYKLPLNAIGNSVLITTGRRLATGVPDGVDAVVVMLDDGHALSTIKGDFEVYWGAYLGTPQEILISGKISDVMETIARARSDARKANGWIMDTYLLRRSVGE